MADLFGRGNGSGTTVRREIERRAEVTRCLPVGFFRGLRVASVQQLVGVSGGREALFSVRSFFFFGFGVVLVAFSGVLQSRLSPGRT